MKIATRFGNESSGLIRHGRIIDPSPTPFQSCYTALSQRLRLYSGTFEIEAGPQPFTELQRCQSPKAIPQGHISQQLPSVVKREEPCRSANYAIVSSFLFRESSYFEYGLGSRNTYLEQRSDYPVVHLPEHAGTLSEVFRSTRSNPAGRTTGLGLGSWLGVIYGKPSRACS